MDGLLDYNWLLCVWNEKSTVTNGTKPAQKERGPMSIQVSSTCSGSRFTRLESRDMSQFILPTDTDPIEEVTRTSLRSSFSTAADKNA